MKKIVLINLFFGQFPWYFNFFLKSCEANKDINFLIFTDNDVDFIFPPNVKLIKASLDSFNELASERLGFKINVRRPYKFCDFKPCFGEIFQNYITEYDFWGMCDIDLVFGRIRNFITDDLLNNFDVISVRHDYTTGFFLLFKNTKEINSLFKKSKDYKKILTSVNNYCFDECNYKYSYLEEPKDILNIDCEIESMLEVLVKENEKGNIIVHFDFLVVEGTPGKLKWDNGILSYNNKFEVLLYHFVAYKYNIFSKKINWDKIPDVFYIDKYNITKSRYVKFLFRYWWIDFIYPSIFNFFQKIEKIISILVYKKRMNIMRKGTYFSVESIWEISNDIYGNNILNTVNEINLPIYELMFNKNYFYVKHHSCFYKFHQSEDKYSENFEEVRKDGNTNIFNWRVPN